MYPFQARLIGNSAMTVGRNLIRDYLTTDSGNGGLVRSINVRDHNAVGIVKSAAEFFSKQFCARITMRLKHRENALPPNGPRRPESCFDFRWVMTVVID